MKKAELHTEDFEVKTILHGSMKTIQVKPKETTDGAEFFECSLDGKNITEIRREETESWEQIWGDLDNIDVQSIGEAIASHIG